jgi:hypothetical protein
MFFAFFLEIMLQCFYKDDYLCLPMWEARQDETFLQTWSGRLQIGSFYFWLDVIATASLILDVNKRIITTFHLLHLFNMFFFHI